MEKSRQAGARYRQAGRSEAEAALREALRGSLGDEADEFLRELDAEIREVAPLDQLGGEISAGDTVNRVWGFARLLLGRGSRPYQKRLPALLRAMRGVQDADTFDLAKESLTEYLDAAQKLTDGGKFRYVVFGHTHQAKKVSLRGGGIYFNSGTWADVLRFPSEILKSDAEALAALDAFVAQMKSGDFSAWTLFRPTYVHLQLGDDGKVSKADLLTFSEVRTS